MTERSVAENPEGVQPYPDPLAGTRYVDLPVWPVVALPSYASVTEQAPELDDPEVTEYPEDGFTAAWEGVDGMTHTPSPLTIHRSIAIDWDQFGNYAIVDTTGRIIGEAYQTVGYGDENQRPAEANARIWAAAPDMLAALLAVLGGPWGHIEACYDSTIAGCTAECALCRAAVVKATGVEP